MRYCLGRKPDNDAPEHQSHHGTQGNTIHHRSLKIKSWCGILLGPGICTFDSPDLAHNITVFDGDTIRRDDTHRKENLLPCYINGSKINREVDVRRRVEELAIDGRSLTTTDERVLY